MKRASSASTSHGGAAPKATPARAGAPTATSEAAITTTNSDSEKKTTAAQWAQQLPIYRQQEEILAAIKSHQAVVVEGPPGTGKTTQLPRMLRRAGLTQTCMGITQPRRIAAVSVAARIAEEEGVQLGSQVGYAIRFDDVTSPQTVVKVMTDGLLLQEARTDPELRAYDMIMVDEAHERSLNIDFTLGLLHRIIPRRADFRVVVSSATLHPGLFQRFFENVSGDVPVVSIKQDMFPLDIKHRPLRSGAPYELADSVARQVLHMHQSGDPGHVLVFLPGEAAIRQAQEAIEAHLTAFRDYLVIPLYGRLKRQEQERVFYDYEGRRKIVLATNIAETSITIPDVAFVIDSGLAKVPWFHPKTGITTLRETPISQASAKQRAGRAGRTRAGKVVRLYSRGGYEQMDPFTPEEILRVDLSEAVLRLIDLGVRDVERFSFPTAPTPGRVRAALETLHALGAINEARELTDIGKRMVPFPLSPALARMVVESDERFPQAMRDVLLMGAFLSVRSPYLFPAGREFEARRAQHQLAQPQGDAATAMHTYRLWAQSDDRDGLCQRMFLDPDLMAFIHKALQQLIDIASEHGLQVPSEHEAGKPRPDHVAQCLTAGFPDRIMRARGNMYQTVTGQRVALHPSSSLYRFEPRYAIAPDIMQASRTYAFSATALKAEWVEHYHPEAAAAWGLRGKRRSKSQQDRGAPVRAGANGAPVAPGQAGSDTHEGSREAPAKPEALDLLGMSLPITWTGDRTAFVGLSLDTARALQDRAKQQDGLIPMPDCRPFRLRGGIATAFDRVLCGGKLKRLLRLLPALPLGTADAKPLTPPPPYGALLEPDRNAATIERFLPQLLALGHDPQDRKVGWLGLVHNGAGGFWFEFFNQYPDAVHNSREALRAGLDTYDVELGDATVAFQRTLDRLDDAKNLLSQAKDQAEGERKGRRGRGRSQRGRRRA